MTDITPERVRAWLDGDGLALPPNIEHLARAYLDMAARVEELNGELSRLRRIDRKLIIKTEHE